MPSENEPSAYCHLKFQASMQAESPRMMSDLTCGSYDVYETNYLLNLKDRASISILILVSRPHCNDCCNDPSNDRYVTGCSTVDHNLTSSSYQ